MQRRVIGVTITVFAWAALCGTGAAQELTTPVPRASPMPVTAASRPFLGANHNEPPLDLAKTGYVEEEFQVSGDAHVYDWRPDRVLAVRGTAPYTTRILVRRPSSAARFSGVVVVELFNSARRFDWGMMWGYLHPHLMARGDAWVGITLPGALPGLKAFDPARYAALSFRNPATTPCPGATGAASATEDGLRWDAISQIGALLKSRAAGAPLARFDVRAIYLTSQGGDLTVYMNAIGPRARLANGRAVYDGYLARAPFGLARMNQCAPAPAADDPRQIVGAAGVPVIAVATQGEVPTTAAARRDDSDAPDDRYRLYEVAGAGHIDRFAYTGFPSTADQQAAGNLQGTPDWPFTAPCTPPIPLMPTPILGTAYDAALDALDAWVRTGVAAPRAERIALRTPSSSTPAVATDEFGHARGGFRTPYVEAPVAAYTTNGAGPGACPEMGAVKPFDHAMLTATYGSRQGYAQRLDAAVARLRQGRWLTVDDARRVRAELLRAWK